MSYLKQIYSMILVIALVSSVLSGVSAINTPFCDIIYVSMNGNDNNTGLTPELSKKTIQNAVKTAKYGDTIQIAPGTYQENIIDINKKLTLKGTDPKTTIIQGKESKSIASTIAVDVGGDVSIQKLTITRVKTKKTSRGIWNAGILTVEDTIITDHNGGGGGGFYNIGTLTVKNCQIINNKVNGYGGGILNYRGKVIIQNSIISGNEAKSYFRGHGGGIVNGMGRVDIYDSVISNNNAEYGGGLYNLDGELTLINSEVINNVAYDGGGLYNYGYGLVTLKKVSINDNKPQNVAGSTGWIKWIYR